MKWRYKPIVDNSSEPLDGSPADPFVMLLYVLLRRSGGEVTVDLNEAVQLPVGWRDKTIVIERTLDGGMLYRLTDFPRHTPNVVEHSPELQSQQADINLANTVLQRWQLAETTS